MLNLRAGLRVALFALMLALVACGSATPTASTPRASATAPTTSSGRLPSTAAEPTGSANAASSASNTTSTAATATGYAAIPQSKTPQGYHQLGSPDAPAVMMHYSDFI